MHFGVDVLSVCVSWDLMTLALQAFHALSLPEFLFEKVCESQSNRLMITAASHHACQMTDPY